MKTTEEPFEELYIPHRELQNPNAVCYRVYNDSKNYELVEAFSALEALTQSKIEKPYKIERHNPLGDNVIHIKYATNILIGEGGVAPTIEKQIEHTLELNTPEMITEVAIATENIGLSNEEVDKLLNG